MKRVVITGQGTVNPLGNNVALTRLSMQQGRLAIGPLDILDVERLTIRIGAAVKSFSPDVHFTKPELAFLDRFSQLALVAAREAIAQSGLLFSGELAERTGVILGSAGGGMQTQDENYRNVYQDGKNRVHPFVVPRLMHNAAASQISMAFNLLGPTYCVATACASSNHAMGQAFHLIRSGACTAVVTGGTDSMLTFGGIKAWEGLRVLSPDGCRPFSATRNGMVLGEGAAVFVFEDYDHARARGADILAEVAGFAMTSDAADIVTPSKSGAARSMRLALKDAALNPEDVGYINAHGTGTMANDKTESAAILDVFGQHAERLMVSSTKSMHGHLIGATGAVELLAAIMALRDEVIAPTIGYQIPDPDCPLDVVPNTARSATVRAVLSNAFAFGGLNAVLALKAI
ncbi:MAG: beta-ketoacyl-[acyl-carrier-protein] synthase family protein [Proteobacteria bacterium]|nr:beta-ketoacyl-[acyl-carrier-protein] synthase family protein [Pseudomonadota bacterium]MDA1287639.1 beta-ketoacyl-[acyl-carrier-protein] synthase family protein [Pseudomonadota bacterium]